MQFEVSLSSPVSWQGLGQATGITSSMYWEVVGVGAVLAVLILWLTRKRRRSR